ncbi:MAG: 50S ribosomal protein L3 [Chlamydiales bacterium]|nr:50S ribosomal protein L3 [Chlamydiales bacterium]
MALKLMGKKRGMIQLFDDTGAVIVCTLIEAEPNVVTQVKTTETDGYNAVQIGFQKVKAKDPRRQEARTPKPQRGHFAKNNIEPRKHLAETRVEKTDQYTIGQEIGVDAFEEIAYVDVTGVSKGKGFQGTMKKYNFAGGPASHGSGFHRHAGSTGMRTTPGRCFPGGPRPSHMGSEQVTVQGLQVIKIVKDENLILVKGAIPGSPGDLVFISPAIKHTTTKRTSGVKLWQQ